MRALILVATLLATAVVTFSGSFYSGSNTCPSSGSKQVSTTSYTLTQLTVSALAANTGKVYFGSSAVASGTGGEVIAGGNYNASGTNINPAALYFACSASGDSIAWIGHN
jgi:hypothetical protein